MEVESLNWFRFSKCLVTVGTEVLRELLKFNIQTCSFSEYHKLWLKKVNLHGQSAGVKVLWSSLEQHHRTLDASSQQSLQLLLSKWKCSCRFKDMDIRQQLSVLKTWEDDIQDFRSNHTTQHDTLNKWSSELQSVTSLLTLIQAWTQEFVNLCQVNQLDLVCLTEQHHERTKHLSKGFLNKLESCIRHRPEELYSVFNIFQQDEVNSECALKSELHVFFTSWQPKIDKLLDRWITLISSSPHQQILQTLVTDVKNYLPRVHQMCQKELQGICCTWHNNLQMKLAEWHSQLQKVSASTSDLAQSWHNDLQTFPPASDQQTRDFFYSKIPDVQNLRTRRIITDPQWLYLYPTHGYIDLQKFDITLLYTLHRNLFPICPPELGWNGEILETDHSVGADLMRLKKIRNDYIGHIPDPTLTNSEFEKLWRILEASLNRLSKALGHKFQEQVSQKAAELKSCPFEIHEELKLQLELINWYQGDILDLDEKVEKCLCLLHTLDEKVQKLYQRQAINASEMQDFKTQTDHMMQGMKRTIDSHATDVSERMSRIETSINRFEKSIIEGMNKLETRMIGFETILSNPRVDRSKLDKRIDLMRGRIETHTRGNANVHIRTRAFDNARDIMLKHKHLVVEGKPGEGKTYLALSLVADLIEMDKKWQPVEIYNTNEWEEMVDMKIPLVVLLDDVLGKYGVSETDLDRWKKSSELIHPNLSSSSIFLIVCIGTQIASSIKSSLRRNEAFNLMFNSHVVDISNDQHCLTKEEKAQMLTRYVPKCLEGNNKFIVEDIIQMENVLGFPLNCKIFRSRPNLMGDMKENFANNMFLADEIVEISKNNPETYMFLVLLMLSGGSLSLENKIEELNNKIKTIFDDCGLKKLNISQIKHIGESLCGVFVEYSTKTKKFKFQHDSIETVVFSSFGKDYPDVTLRLCSLKQLSKMCCTANEFGSFDDEDFLNFKIMVDKDHFIVLLERFNEGLESGKKESFKHISEALIWKDLRFVAYYSNKMTSVNDMLSFLSKRDPDGHSLLTHLIYAKNTLAVKGIIANISHCNIRDNHLVARQILLATTNACLSEEKDILKDLIKFQEKVDDFVMLAAASMGNVSVMEMLVLRGGNTNATMNVKVKVDLINGIKNCVSYPKASSYLHDINIFHIACSYGRTDMVKYLITYYPDLVHRTTNLGVTAIHFAALSENVELMKVLSAEQVDHSDDSAQARIPAEFDITASNSEGVNVLHIAAWKDNHTMLKYLMENYPQLIQQTDKHGRTSIHYAAMGGSVPVLETLIQAGLDITGITNDGEHVLHMAAVNDNVTIVKYLIKTYPRLIQQTTKNGWSAVHCAAKGGSVPVIETLIQAGLDITARTNNGLHVLHIAAGEDNLTVVKYLTQTHPRIIQPTDEKGWTALHHAATGGSVPVVETLVKAGLDITGRTNTGEHVLHVAARTDNLTIVKYLIQTYPGLMQQTDKNGWTVLHYAAASGSVPVIKTLIEAGLDIASIASNGWNVLNFAARNDNPTVVKYLIETYPRLMQQTDDIGWTSIHCAAAGGSVPVIKTLIEAELDITGRANNGEHVLHVAARNDNLTIVKYLIETYPGLMQQTDKNGLTVLHYAAAGGSVPVIETLIEAGLDITGRANNGEHILHVAARYDNLTIVKYLIQTFPRLMQQTDNNGWTAVRSAAVSRNVNVVKTLIEALQDIAASKIA